MRPKRKNIKSERHKNSYIWIINDKGKYLNIDGNVALENFPHDEFMRITNIISVGLKP